MTARRCARRHLIAGANVRWTVSHGKRRKACRRCFNAYMAPYMARRRKAAKRATARKGRGR